MTMGDLANLILLLMAMIPVFLVIISEMTPPPRRETSKRIDIKLLKKGGTLWQKR